MTLEIKRRYDFDSWEPIAEYDGEEFTGDGDFLDHFGWLEGESEERIMEELDGPNLLAMRPEESEEEDQEKSGTDTPLADEIAQAASESLSEKLGSGAAGAGQATYGGARDTTEPHPDEEDEEEEESEYQKSREYVDNVHEAPEDAVVQVDEDDDLYYEKSRPAWEVLEARRQKSLRKSEGFERIDDELMKFYTHIVWWGLEKDDPDFGKAPNMWESSEHVPDFVQDFIERAVQGDAFWQGRLENLPSGAAQFLQDLFREKMTQPQGWSLGSIIDDLQEKYPGADTDYLAMITRNETAALANKAREEAYEEHPDAETAEFYWSGPQDFRTTDVCEEMKDRTHPNYGGTPRPLDELRDILYEVADDHPEGSTDRIEEWVPHFQCRHTFVRKVYL